MPSRLVSLKTYSLCRRIRRLTGRSSRRDKGVSFMSSTVRTLAVLKKEGYTAQVVEYYNQFARRRIDLFGIIDIVALRPDETLGIQTTSGAIRRSARPCGIASL